MAHPDMLARLHAIVSCYCLIVESIACMVVRAPGAHGQHKQFGQTWRVTQWLL